MEENQIQGIASGQAERIAQEGLEWLYINPLTLKANDENINEDYLLGKPVVGANDDMGTSFELTHLQKSVVHLPNHYIAKVTEDSFRKLREDPLFVIKQAELVTKKLSKTVKRDSIKRRKAKKSKKRNYGNNRKGK